MRIFISILLITLSLAGYSQADTEESKLIKYKGMYEKGLIDSGDYSQLKKSILFKNEVEPRKEKSLAELKNKSTGKIIAGPVLMGIGVAFMGVGVVFPFPNVAEASRGLNRGFLIGTGVVCATVGAVLLGSGIANRVVYLEKRKLTAGLLSSGNVGANLNF